MLDLAASSLPTLHWGEALLRLALAGGLGGLIGIERELREREAGLRTHLLVSLGSALFTIVGAYGFHEFLSSGATVVRADPTRIAAQIVTGIGFLGAGAIIRQGLSVRGLTTAATLWVVAAVGLACGAGSYGVAVITTVIVLFALYPLRMIAYRGLLPFRPENGRLIVDLPGGAAPGKVIDAVEATGARLDSLVVSQEGTLRRLELEVVLARHTHPPGLVSQLAELENVVEVRWTD
ncbi:MAG: MgtC/SapB family protein [Gaiellaceae bacterium]